MSNDPQAPFPGARSPQDGPDGADQAPSAPQYAAPQQPSPESQPSAPPYAPPPASPNQPAGGYPPPGYAAAPQMGGVPSQAGQPADLLTRFLARLIDYVILFVVNLILVTIIIVGALMGDSAGFGGFGSGDFAGAAVSSVVAAVIYVGYFSYLESTRGQTVGKMALKLKVQGPGGGNPTMAEAVKRNAWVGLGILGVVPVIGGLIGALLQLAAVIYIAVTINNNVATRQGWHDEFAGGTRVVKTA